MTQALVSGLANGGIYGLLAVGLVLVYKGSRVLNFAQGELGTFALFVGWGLIADWGWPWLAGAAVAVGSCALIGLGFERFVVRRMGDESRLSVTVATVGLLLLLIALELKLWGTSPKVLGPPISGLGPKVAGYYVSPTQMLAVAATLVIGVGLAAFLQRTDFGLGVLAAAHDPVAVRLVGVRAGRITAFTWGTAGAIGAVAALLVEPTIGAFAPGFMTVLFVRALAAALLGGVNSLVGAFVGGLSVGVIEAVVGRQFVQSTFPGVQSVVVFLIIIGVLLFRPQGIMGGRAR